MDLPYVIFEVANVHGGAVDSLFGIIDQYKQVSYSRKAIKFQPFKADKIALPDFKGFPIYLELFFEPDLWQNLINVSKDAGDVWLDLFDEYSVKILSENIGQISGIKLQASVLDNADLIANISELELGDLDLIVNVSGYEISQIERYVAQFAKLGVADIILQIGFQRYPTSVDDTGLQKIPVLKSAFPHMPLCMADHAPAESFVAQQIPVWSTIAGCSYIEKHFCATRDGAKYDYFSALEPKEFNNMLVNMRELISAHSGSFLSVSEKKYLKESYQAPVARKKMLPGSLVGLSDMRFRRTDQVGFTWDEISAEQSRFKVLTTAVEENSTINHSSLTRAKIAVIVACRMKSSRLQKKAILPINGVPSVERCLENCALMPHVNKIVLATSTHEDDSVLKKFTLGGQVEIWRGDPIDVIKRYIGACDLYDIDVVVRVTADCPVISPELTGFLLKSHFEQGADYTAAISSAVGSSPEIYNVQALRRVISLLGKADHSEYMTWYMQNNKDIFKVNLVDIPAELNRDYRLTLDYQEDLDMFDRLYSVLEEKGLSPTLTNVFSVLDADITISTMNTHLSLTYQTDKALIEHLNKVTRIIDNTDN